MSARTSILLVEDDARLAELVGGFLSGHGFQVTVADLGRNVPDQVRLLAPDLVVLDLGLPGEDGMAICRRLRPDYCRPILMLTARGNDIDHVLGLELGADDYVIKPVEPRLLLARINALLRRTAAAPDPRRRNMTFGRLVIDGSSRTAALNGDPVALSGSEFDLLWQLASHPGEVQSRDTLFRHLYNREYDGVDRMLDIRVSHLRRKLGDDGDVAAGIKTVWGRGYLFVPGAW
jgi:two-component system, OmpR family, response regulator